MSDVITLLQATLDLLWRGAAVASLHLEEGLRAPAQGGNAEFIHVRLVSEPTRWLQPPIVIPGCKASMTVFNSSGLLLGEFWCRWTDNVEPTGQQAWHPETMNVNPNGDYRIPLVARPFGGPAVAFSFLPEKRTGAAQAIQLPPDVYTISVTVTTNKKPVQADFQVTVPSHPAVALHVKKMP
jgi:hypothetical protein